MFAVLCRIDRRRSKSCKESHQRTVKWLFLWVEFMRGIEKRKEKLVRGVGFNDADYPIARLAMVNGKRKDVWRCPFYRAWKNMIERCYSPDFIASHPTYKDCVVCNEWLTFSCFRTWMISQPWEGNQLDKDLLVDGNKTYGPEFCAFISSEVNGFLCDSLVSRGRWPRGVYFNKGAKKFQAYCRNNWTDKQEYLGLFMSPDLAHEAWRIRKHEHALAYASMQSDPRVANALMTRFSISSIEKMEK